MVQLEMQEYAKAQAALSVELCGKLADAAGAHILVTIPNAGLTVAELFALLSERPFLKNDLADGRIRACVNEVIASPEQPIVPGDTVALFPPVSGG